MAIKTEPFDAARYLTSAESQTDLIADALETGDVAYIATALGTIARARGMTKVAKEAGVTREALYKALAAGGDPRLSTLLGVMKALGKRIDVVDHRSEQVEVRLVATVADAVHQIQHPMQDRRERTVLIDNDADCFQVRSFSGLSAGAAPQIAS